MRSVEAGKGKNGKAIHCAKGAPRGVRYIHRHRHIYVYMYRHRHTYIGGFNFVAISQSFCGQQAWSVEAGIREFLPPSSRPSSDLPIVRCRPADRHLITFSTLHYMSANFTLLFQLSSVAQRYNIRPAIRTSQVRAPAGDSEKKCT